MDSFSESSLDGEQVHLLQISPLLCFLQPLACSVRPPHRSPAPMPWGLLKSCGQQRCWVPLILEEVGTWRDSSPLGSRWGQAEPQARRMAPPCCVGRWFFSFVSIPARGKALSPWVVKARRRANWLGIASQLPGARRGRVGDVGVMWDGRGGEGDSFPSLSC